MCCGMRMSQRRETRDERARLVDPDACLCAVVRLPTADGAFEFKGLRGVVEFMVMYAPAAGPNSPAALAARLGPEAGASVQSPTDEPRGPVYRKVAGVPIPIEWRVRALRLRGRDVTNEGVDVGQDGTISGIVVEVSADQPPQSGEGAVTSVSSPSVASAGC
jgi:hypothetical protein